MAKKNEKLFTRSETEKKIFKNSSISNFTTEICQKNSEDYILSITDSLISSKKKLYAKICKFFHCFSGCLLNFLYESFGNELFLAFRF